MFVKTQILALTILGMFMLPTAAAEPESTQYHVWKTSVNLTKGFGAEHADLATEWHEGKAKFKLTLYGTFGKFPNEEYVIGPLKQDERTAAHEGKKNTTIKLKLQPNNKEAVINIPGANFTLVSFERKQSTPGAIYWGELPLKKEAYRQLIHSKRWAIASVSEIDGETTEGPDKMGRVFSHRYHRNDRNDWCKAQ